MKAFLKFLAASLSGAAVAGLAALKTAFTGAAPVGVDPLVFGVGAAAIVLIVSYLVGKFGPQV